MISLNFKTIPHSEQRYPTVGDYWAEGDTIQVRVSKLSDWRYEFLVLFHELFELAWVLKNHVSLDEIDAFDKEYEANRKEGDTSEPGDDPRAPYHQGHQWATVLEKIAAMVLGVRWAEYELEVNNL